VVQTDGSSLAGSALAMNRAVAVVMRLTGAPLAVALDAATRAPATLLRRWDVCAAIRPGAPAAHLVLCRPGPEGLAIQATFLAGEEVYRAG
jgi:N-acetylglucosamine-6-phosphate deacetylase